MNRSELGRLIANNCYRERTYTPWGSPAIAFNRKKLSENPTLLREISSHIIDLLLDRTSPLVGIANGATPLVNEISNKSNNSGFLITKDDYNKLSSLDTDIELTNEPATLIDDTICTGSRIIEARLLLTGLGLTIGQVLCVISRGQTGINRLKEQGIIVLALFSGEELASFR